MLCNIDDYCPYTKSVLGPLSELCAQEQCLKHCCHSFSFQNQEVLKKEFLTYLDFLASKLVLALEVVAEEYNSPACPCSTDPLSPHSMHHPLPCRSLLGISPMDLLLQGLMTPLSL